MLYSSIPVFQMFMVIQVISFSKVQMFMVMEALAVVEEVEGEDVAEWVHSYYEMGLDQHFSP